MTTKEKLIISIERSQAAYTYYKEDKMYFQALRIYKANKLVYSLLEEYLLTQNSNLKDQIINYIFHLEDWLNQFEAVEKKMKPALEDTFVFNRMEKSLAFPSEFLKNLNLN